MARVARAAAISRAIVECGGVYCGKGGNELDGMRQRKGD